MNKLLTTLVAFAAFTASANAADLPVRSFTKAPVIVDPGYSWAGGYFGITAGGGWGSFHPSTSTVFDPNGYFVGTGTVAALNSAGAQSIKPTGFTGGLEAGYNWQSGNFVFGIEGDIESFRLRGGATNSAAYPCCAPAGLIVTSNAGTDWLATARIRLGFAAGDWLFFGTGGAAFTNLKANFAFSDNCGQFASCNGPGGANGAETAFFSAVKTGYAVGGGVEKAIGRNWTVKAEYLYADFGSVTGTGIVPATGGGPQTLTHRFDLKANIVRAGLNYRFGGPVVAKY